MDIFIEKTSDCPQIDFKENGELTIGGRSITEDPFSFWQPVLEWVEKYSQTPADKTVLSIYLEYTNSSSSKYINEILRRLETLHLTGKDVSVNWTYDEDDESLCQLGEDFESMVSIPFTFTGVNVDKEQAKKIKIQNKKSGKVAIITHRYWDAIQRNGHGEEYTVVEDIL